ncbi:MAG: hypothetical protein MH204_11095 [Fimbriimonadaceae bacterium]|nr:hypothetical protein [Fimbriimonadaceae bacterium]
MRRNEMTGQERVRRMFARQDQDSLPRMESFWDDTIRNFQAAGHLEDPNVILGSDFQSLCWSETFPYPGQRVQIAEDEETVTVRDAWGQINRYWKARTGTPEHIRFPCMESSDWFDTIKPLMLSNPPSVSIDEASRAMAQGRRLGRWCHFTGLETFEITRHLMGDENAMIAMLEEPDYFRDVSATVTDLVLKDWDHLWEAGVEADGVWVYGDMAFRSGVICGPPLYREMVWPDHKRMADWAHERGLPFNFHTDGDVNAVVEDYIGAGFDCLQPLEAKAGMNVVNLLAEYGDRLAFFGNCDVMIYATRDRDAIEHEIKTKCEAGKKTKGYVYHSDHSIPPSVDWETFQFIVDCVDRYGNYD